MKNPLHSTVRLEGNPSGNRTTPPQRRGVDLQTPARRCAHLSHSREILRRLLKRTVYQIDLYTAVQNVEAGKELKHQGCSGRYLRLLATIYRNKMWGLVGRRTAFAFVFLLLVLRLFVVLVLALALVLVLPFSFSFLVVGNPFGVVASWRICEPWSLLFFFFLLPQAAA